MTHIISTACSAPSYYLKQCRNIVNWILRNKLKWNLNQNSYIFIQENAFENVFCKMTAILYQPQCVNKTKNPPSCQVLWHSSMLNEKVATGNLQWHGWMNLQPVAQTCCKQQGQLWHSHHGRVPLDENFGSWVIGPDEWIWQMVWR